MSSVLRPLRLGEILDQTAQLYRRNFLLFAGVAVLPNAVIFSFYIIIIVATGMPLFLRTSSQPPNPAMAVLFLVLIFIAMPLLLIPLVFSHAGVTRAAVNAFRGERLKVREALAGVKPRFWRYLGLMVLQGLIIFGIPGACAGVIGIGLVALSISGGGAAIAAGVLAFVLIVAALAAMVFLLTDFGMALAACVVEDLPATESLGRAHKLAKGTRGRIFVMLLVVWAIAMVLSMIGYIPMIVILGISAAAGHSNQNATAALIIAQIFNMLMNFTLQTLVSPVYLVALVMFYFDQRVRLEGYDIEWMMQQAGLTVPESVTAPPAPLSAVAPTISPAQEQ